MNKPWWLCTEHGETFIIQAEDRDEAHKGAELYGGRVVRQLNPDELKVSPQGITYTEVAA